MLTHEEISQVSQWKDRVGERRPGFLYDHAHGLDGAASACHPATLTSEKDDHQSEEVVRFTVSIGTDSSTGERRLIRK
jgi:hypothetical protein